MEPTVAVSVIPVGGATPRKGDLNGMASLNPGEVARTDSGRPRVRLQSDTGAGDHQLQVALLNSAVTGAPGPRTLQVLPSIVSVRQ